MSSPNDRGDNDDRSDAGGGHDRSDRNNGTDGVSGTDGIGGSDGGEGDDEISGSDGGNEAKGDDGAPYMYAAGVEEPSDLDESRYRLLVPVLSENPLAGVERIMRAAATIARDREGELLVLCIVDVPRQTPYSAITDDQPRVRKARETAQRLLDVAAETDVPAEAIVCFTHQESRAILNVADRHGCDGVFALVDADRSQRRRLLGGETIETIVSHADADVFVEKPGERETPAERILLAASGGPHSGLAAETARAFALAADGEIHVVHFLAEGASESDRADGEEVLEAAREVLENVRHVETDLVETGDVAAEMVSRSAEYDLTVLGAPTTGLLRQFVFGTVPDSVARGAENDVLMTKGRTGVRSAYYRWIAGDAE